MNGIEVETGTAEKLQDLSLSLKGLAELAEIYSWHKEDGGKADDTAIGHFLIYAQKHLAAEIAGLSSAML